MRDCLMSNVKTSSRDTCIGKEIDLYDISWWYNNKLHVLTAERRCQHLLKYTSRLVKQFLVITIFCVWDFWAFIGFAVVLYSVLITEIIHCKWTVLDYAIDDTICSILVIECASNMISSVHERLKIVLIIEAYSLAARDCKERQKICFLFYNSSW